MSECIQRDDCERKLAEAEARGRLAAFTQAIAACDAERLEEPTGTEGDVGYTHGIDDCVAAIENLHDPASPTPERKETT